MFARSASIALLALPILASATSSSRRGGISNSCNTGTLNCCDSVQDSASASATQILHGVGVALDSVTGQVGLTCTPLSVIGTGANSCSAQPACCTGNSFNGVVTLGCTPINLNL